MAANNSTLQIEVVSTGIADTVRKLDLLGNAAGRNEAKVKLLTDSLGKLMVAQNSAVASAAQHASLMSAIAQSMGLVTSAATNTANQVAALNSNLTNLNNTSNATTNAFQKKSAAGNVVNATIRAMTTAALAYMGVNFAKGIVEAADGWKMMQARLKLATGSMEEAKAVQGDLFNMAQRLRVPLEDAAKLYTRMSVPMQRMGKDAKQTAEQVEFVSLALKLNGATAAESSSVMLQYSQAVNAGRLNGAEFNAVAEGAPGILRAIEAELKSTGKWSEHTGKTLKQMGSDGEITFDLMNRASQRALPEMRAAFEQLPLTVDGAIQRVKNAWYKAMGEMGESTDIGTKLAKAIATLEADIPRIRDALASVFLFLHDNFSKIVLVVEAIVAIKLVSWIGGGTAALIGMAQAIPAVVAGMTATATGAAGAATVIGTLRLAALALAGPWGVLIGLVGTAAVAAWQYFGKEAPKADAAVTASTRVQTVDRIKLIQKEIDKLNERNGVVAKPVAAQADALPADIMAQLKVVNGFRQRQAAERNDFNRRMLQIDIDAGQATFERMVGENTKLNALRKVNANNINVDKAKGITDKITKETANDLEKFKIAVGEYKKQYAELGQAMPAGLEGRLKRSMLGKGGEGNTKVDHYKNITSAIKATTAELELNIATGNKASASEKMRAALDAGKNTDYNKLSPSRKGEVDSMLAENRALEKKIELRDKIDKANIDAAAEADKFNTKLQSGILSISDETDRTRLQIAALTESKTAVKELTAARIEADAKAAESMAIKQMDKNGDMVQYELYMAQARALRELADAKVALGKGQDEKLANDALDKLLDPKRALDFGDSLKDAFGKAGEAIGDMSKALGIYGKTQEKIDKDRKLFMNSPDSAKRQAGLAALDKQEVQSKLRAYGDMAAGAKSFFKENSTGYKVMAATEKAFRIAEMAMTIESTALKVWASLTATGAKEGENLAVAQGQALDAAGTGGMIANALARTGAYVMEGASKMFAILGPWGVVGVAAMLAVMASVGFSGGGSSGGSVVSAEDRQAKQGTGTVLGDDTAKSESLLKALEAVKDNSNIGLVHTSNMLASLRNIEASMQGLASAIYKTSGMTTGKNFGIQEGTTGGGFLSSVFGGKTSTTITDTGLAINGTAGQMRNGEGVNQYVDVNHQKSGGWFRSDKSWNTRDYKVADSEITNTIGRTFSEINSTISEAATSLGGNGAAISAALDAYVVNTEISFKDLKGDELQQALNNVFSAAADGMARSVFPGLEAFQSAGEGYYQTVVRVSTGTEQAQNALESFGIQMVDMHSLTNKTGDIASELVRQSIMAAEAGTTMAEVMRVMDGGMNDLVAGYRSLLSIRDTMRGAGLGSSISMDTIRGAGGVTELESALSDFVDGFYTDTEKQVISFSKLRAEFRRLNVAMPATKDGFKGLVTSLMAGDAASKELAGRVLLLGGAFADAFQEADTARKDGVEKAKDNLRDAYDKEADALEGIIDKMKGFTNSLKSFKDTLIMGELSTKSSYEKYATAKVNYDSTSALALGGDEKAISEYEKVASEMLKYSRELNASGVNYTADYDRVLAETEALRKFTANQVDVATASLNILKSQVDTLLDINKSVLSVASAISALTLAMLVPGVKGSPAEASAAGPIADMYSRFRGGASGSNDKVFWEAQLANGMSLEEVLKGIQNSTEYLAINGSHANGLSSVPFDGYIAELHKGEAVLTASENNEYRSNLGNVSVRTDGAMVNELKALREELKQLREEQREQTSHMIAAGYDSNERNANVVVSGTRGAMEDASYLERTKTGLV